MNLRIYGAVGSNTVALKRHRWNGLCSRILLYRVLLFGNLIYKIIMEDCNKEFNKMELTEFELFNYRAGKEFTLSKLFTNLFSHSWPSVGAKSSLATQA